MNKMPLFWGHETEAILRQLTWFSTHKKSHTYTHWASDTQVIDLFTCSSGDVSCTHYLESLLPTLGDPGATDSRERTKISRDKSGPAKVNKTEDLLHEISALGLRECLYPKRAKLAVPTVLPIGSGSITYAFQHIKLSVSELLRFDCFFNISLGGKKIKLQIWDTAGQER